MTEQATQQQESQQQSQANEQASEPRTERSNEERTEATVPSSRLREETRLRKEAEKEARTLRESQQQAEEATAQEQGKYQELAQKRQTKVEQLQTKVSELEATIVTGERYRAFSKAANGVLLPEAVDDAFLMLGDDDFSTADTNDENSYRALAQQLAERKPYLSDGVRGAGSGGSSSPIFGGSKGSSKPSTNRIAALNSEKKRRSFK